ncbi:MAG TPA: Ig-like domain-containing protein [Pirellulales bacterium]|nr:Ig-like domain-containing protein [Pirellulales bacterium]
MQFTLKQLLAAMTGVAVLAALAADGYCELAILAVLLTGFGLILRRLAGRRRQKRRYHKAAFESLLLVIVAALILPSATTTAIWDGRARVSLTFIVTEQESGNPVSGARVEIGQAPLSAFRLEAQAATDSQGRATINITLPASGRDRLCEHTGYAFFRPTHWVRVTSPQHAANAAALRDFTGDQYDLRRRAPIKPIRIELKRASPPP